MVAETTLQQAATAYLRRRQVRSGDLVFAHIPNEGKRNSTQKSRMAREGLVRGAPDLVVWLKGGRVISIELKTASGRMSEFQEEFRDNLASIGHEYYEVRASDPGEIIAKIENLLKSPSVSVVDF